MSYFISPLLEAYNYKPVDVPKSVDLDSNVFTPRMSAISFKTSKLSKKLKRRAKFAPQLLADGLSSGIVDKQGNLVHGAFDEGTDIDPFVNIQSDKFDILQRGLDAVTVDPGSTQPSTDGASSSTE